MLLILPFLPCSTKIVVEVLRVWNERDGSQTLELFDLVNKRSFQINTEKIFKNVDVVKVFIKTYFCDLFCDGLKDTGSDTPTQTIKVINPVLKNIRMER